MSKNCNCSEVNPNCSGGKIRAFSKKCILYTGPQYIFALFFSLKDWKKGENMEDPIEIKHFSTLRNCMSI